MGKSCFGGILHSQLINAASTFLTMQIFRYNAQMKKHVKVSVKGLFIIQILNLQKCILSFLDGYIIHKYIVHIVKTDVK